MNVEIGAEAVLFPKKEYINGIAVAVYMYSRGGQANFIKKSANRKSAFSWLIPQS
jgi:hypothetical protein